MSARSRTLAASSTPASTSSTATGARLGFKISQTIRDLELLTKNPAWPKLRAAQSGQVYLIDGHHFFNRPGPRLVESAEIVSEILHGDRFVCRHRGTGWIPLKDAAIQSQQLVPFTGAN